MYHPIATRISSNRAKSKKRSGAYLAHMDLSRLEASACWSPVQCHVYEPNVIP